MVLKKSLKRGQVQNVLWSTEKDKIRKIPIYGHLPEVRNFFSSRKGYGVCVSKRVGLEVTVIKSSDGKRKVYKDKGGDMTFYSRRDCNSFFR